MALNPCTVVLARHGRTAWHHPTRYTGRSDIPLDEVGTAQARTLGRWAAGQGFTALACSPLVRARVTAEAVTARTGLAARVEPDLRELDFGVAEGRTLAELAALDPAAAARFRADPAANPWPGGEAPGAAARRVVAGLSRLAAAEPGGRLLAVAHSTVIRLALCAWLGIPLGSYRRALPRHEPGWLTVLSVPPGGGPVALLHYNVPPGTFRLDGDDPTALPAPRAGKTDGTDGRRGPDGTDGRRGPDGTDGTDGRRGPDGTDGPRGSDRTPGTGGARGSGGTGGARGSGRVPGGGGTGSAGGTGHR